MSLHKGGTASLQCQTKLRGGPSEIRELENFHLCMRIGLNIGLRILLLRHVHILGVTNEEDCFLYLNTWEDGTMFIAIFHYIILAHFLNIHYADLHFIY